MLLSFTMFIVEIRLDQKTHLQVETMQLTYQSQPVATPHVCYIIQEVQNIFDKVTSWPLYNYCSYIATQPIQVYVALGNEGYYDL